MVAFLYVQLFFAKQYKIGCHVGVHLGADEVNWGDLLVCFLFSTHTSISSFAKNILPE